MELAGQELPTNPQIPDKHTLELRARLIAEEFSELLMGFGFGFSLNIWNSENPDNNFYESYSSVTKPNLVSIADGIADLTVVSTGTGLACGIPVEEIQEAVDENNLKKFGPGGYRDSNGKWIKPIGFKGPDIQGIISRAIDTDNSFKIKSEDFKKWCLCKDLNRDCWVVLQRDIKDGALSYDPNYGTTVICESEESANNMLISLQNQEGVITSER